MTTQDPFGTPDKADPFGTPTGGRGHDYSDAEDRAEVPRDQWDRYLIPGPDGIKPAVTKGRTRVSTTKSVGSDQTRLQARAERLIIQGLGMDPHLNAEAMRAQALTPDSREQKRALAQVSLKAFERAGGNDRRDRGTEFHELIDALAKDPATVIPERLTADVAAYREALKRHDIEPLPEFSESVVICPYDHGGAIDSIARRWNADTEMYEYVVVDLKTGRTLEYSKVEFLSQLWFYANAYYRFITTAIERDNDGKITAVRGYMEELPLELRTDKVLLIHVPLDGTADIYELDISGWGRVVAAQIELRRANAEAKHRYRLLGTVRPDAFVTQPAPVVETRQGVVVVPADQGPSFTPTPAAPTPDAAAQVAKAQERTTLAAKTLAPTSDQAVTTPPVTITHDPVTGRKKRTCGFCHLPGHTQKNCPTNPTSARYVRPVLSVVPKSEDYPVNVTINGEQATVTRVDAMAKAAGRNDDSDDPIGGPITLSDQENAPYCLRQHPDPCQWTSQPPAPPGTWACSITGKPAENAWHNGTIAVTSEPPFYGAPQPEQRVPGTEINTWPPAEGVGTWDAPPDMIAWGISNAETVTALLAHRTSCIAAGTWNQHYDTMGAARYQALS